MRSKAGMAALFAGTEQPGPTCQHLEKGSTTVERMLQEPNLNVLQLLLLLCLQACAGC
jgi:hypothetical protein